MLRPIMTKMMMRKAAQEHAGIPQQIGCAYFGNRRPARRAVGRRMTNLPRPQDRSEDRDDDGRQTATCGKSSTLGEDARCITIERVPPHEEGGRRIDGSAAEREPGRAKRGLVAEPPCRPFGGKPDAGQDQTQRHQHLSEEDRGRFHVPLAK